MLTPQLQQLDVEQRNVVQSELKSDERLAWASPALPRYFSGPAIGAVLFGIPWTAFAIFWEVMALAGTRSMRGNSGMATGFKYLFPLFGLPFVLVGFGMLSTPFWMARRLKRTIYVITDKRAIVLSPGWFGARKIQSFAPDVMASMERTERRDGSGDLIFEEYTQRRGSSSQTIRKGFFCVPNVREVEDLLRNTLLKERARSV